MGILTENISSQAKISQKEGQPRFNMSLTSWLDRLLRTNYAVANLVKDAVDEGDFTPMQSIWKGLTGEDKTLFGDVMSEAGWEPASKPEEAAKFIAGLGADVLLDPLTYIGIGGLTKAGRLAQKMGKLAPTLTKQAGLGQKALLQFAGRPVIKGAPVLKGMAKAGTAIRGLPPIQALGKAFIPAFRPAGVSAEAWAKLMRAQRMGKDIQRLGGQRALEFSTGILDDIKKLTKGGIINDTDVAKVLEAVERRSFGASLPAKTHGLWKKLTGYADDIAKKRKVVGKTLLDDDQYSYWLHTLSKPEIETLRKTGLDIGFKEYATKTASDITRKYVKVGGKIQKLSKSQQNKLIKQGIKIEQVSIDEINKVLGREFFSTDIPWTSYVMGRRMAKAEGGQVFFDMASEIGSKKPLKGWIKSTAPELKGLHFPAQIVDEIDKIRKVFTGEPQAKEFLRWFDKIQNTWKLWTLGPFPAYHFRNIIGNTWNNYLGGVVNPGVYKQALKLQMKKLRNIALTPDETKLWAMAEKFGVLGRGIMRAELPQMGAPALKPTLGRKLGAPAIRGMQMGGHIEDNARLAHFIDKIRKGWSAEEAAISVKKYLFDYGDLTGFEQNVMKRLMPFYTWTRKNIPLQLESLIKTPGRPMLLEKTRQEAYRRVGNPPEEFMPEYIRERMPFFLGKQKKEYTYFPMESWIPFADLMKVTPERAKDVVGELLTPVLKIPLEMAANKMWYFNRPIEDYPGEMEEFLKVDMPAHLVYLARNVRVLSEIHRLVGYKRKAIAAPPEPSRFEKGLRAVTGIKAARYDIQKSIRTKKWEIKEELEKLWIGLSRAKKYGRKEETSRVATQIFKLKKQLEKLP